MVCKAPVRDTLINFARGFMYSTAPSFPMVAAIRAGYKLLMTNQTQHVSVNSRIQPVKSRLRSVWRGMG